MVKSKLFLIHGGYDIDEDGTTAVFYGRSDKGNVVRIEDKFDPFIYIENVSKFDLKMLQKIEDDYGRKLLKSYEYTTGIDDYGRNISVCRLNLLFPTAVYTLKKWAYSHRKRLFSADILYPLRYIYSKNIGAFVEAEGKYMGNDTISVKSYKDCKAFKPNLRVMSFDIETSPMKGTLFMIGVYVTNIDGTRPNTYKMSGDEEYILRKFIETVNREDPDIMVGYNIDGFDWPIIMDKAEEFGVDMTIGRGNKKVIYSNKEGVMRLNIPGRASVDLMKRIRRTLKPVSERLDDVAKQMGLEGKVEGIDASKMDELWVERKEDIKDYCIQDCKVTYNIFMHDSLRFIDSAIALSKVSMLPLSETITYSDSRLIDSILIREFEKNSYLIPMHKFTKKDNKKKKRYTGAYVMEPPAGLFHNVIVLDFKSMYPSMIIKNNICYTTYRSYKERDTEEIDTPGGKHYFIKREKKVGIIPNVLIGLMDERDKAKRKLKETGNEYYNRLQDALKVLMNALYGVFGSDFYRFTNIGIAESTTTTARNTIINSINMIQDELGYFVLHSHTDSVFVLGGEDKSLEELIEIGNYISEKCTEGYSKLQLEQIFSRFFTYGAKTMYFGKAIWPKQEMKIRGFAIRRKDSFELQRDILNRTIEAIVSDVSPKEYFTQFSKDMRDYLTYGMDTKKLVLTKTVGDINSYKNDKIPHVSAAKKLIREGVPFFNNMRVSWIVTGVDNSGKQIVEPVIEGRELPRPYRKYYINRILDSIEPIAEVFGFDRVDIKTGKFQYTFEDLGFGGD